MTIHSIIWSLAVGLGAVCPFSVQRIASTKALVLSSSSSNNNNGFNVNGGFPPSDEGKPRPSKADLYSNDELQSLLNLHQSLNDNGGFGGSPSTTEQQQQQPQDAFPSVGGTDEGPVPFGLHDVVLQTLQEMDQSSPASARPLEEENVTNKGDTTSEKSSIYYKLSKQDEQILSKIRAIASDVDGTLVSSDQTVHPTTQRAVKQAIEDAFSPVRRLGYFFPATGKTRAALASLGPELAAMLSQCPGVFVQGLYCVDGAGNVVYEEKLGTQAADAVIEFGHANGLTVLGYDGDKIFTTPKSNPQHVRDIHEVWGEPAAIVVDNMLGYKGGFHKCLIWSDDPNAITNTFRPQLEALTASHSGTVTQAIPTMLEFLPKGASKALGVQKLCEHLGIDMSTELLAIGDAENDVGFLQESAFGVAVGNAVPKAKEAANLVLKETNDQGGAGLAIDLFGLGGAFR